MRSLIAISTFAIALTACTTTGAAREHRRGWPHRHASRRDNPRRSPTTTAASTTSNLDGDSRCRPDVQCVWAGDATIAMRWTPAAGGMVAQDFTAHQPRSQILRRQRPHHHPHRAERGDAPKATQVECRALNPATSFSRRRVRGQPPTGVTRSGYVSTCRGRASGRQGIGRTKLIRSGIPRNVLLVLGGCGSAALAANFGGDGNLLGIGLHRRWPSAPCSPAPTLRPVPARQSRGPRAALPTRDLVPYIVAQVLGAILAGFILFQIASGTAGFAIDLNAAGAFRHEWLRRAFARRLQHGRSIDPEVVMTAMFLIVIWARPTARRQPASRADRHRPGADPDPPDQHPGDEHLGEPGAFPPASRCSPGRARSRSLAVLAGARSSAASRRRDLQVVRPGSPGRGRRPALIA